MRKLIMILLIIGTTLPLCSTPISAATMLWFDPTQQLYDAGETLLFELRAEIDYVDAIFGFGFDLSFDNGISYITAPYESGSFLTFKEFMPNTTLFEDPSDPLFVPPLWEDGDTISGEVRFDSIDPFVYGQDILLGIFSFEAPDTAPIGLENIFLGAPDLNPNEFYDGLFRIGLGDPSLPLAFMPNNPTASAAPVPESATILLLVSGMVGMGVFGRKKFRKSKI